MTRTTISFDDRLYRALKLKAAVTSRGLSDIVADAVRLSLKEDSLDLQSFEDRKGEPARPFEDVLRRLKADGLL